MLVHSLCSVIEVEDQISDPYYLPALNLWEKQRALEISLQSFCSWGWWWCKEWTGKEKIACRKLFFFLSFSFPTPTLNKGSQSSLSNNLNTYVSHGGAFYLIENFNFPILQLIKLQIWLLFYPIFNFLTSNSRQSFCFKTSLFFLSLLTFTCFHGMMFHPIGIRFSCPLKFYISCKLYSLK